MWKYLFDFAKAIFLLQRETQQNKEDINKCEQDVKDARRELKDLQAEFNKLLLLVEKLAFEIRRVDEREETEREKLALQLSNEMLKFERRLPSGKE